MHIWCARLGSSQPVKISDFPLRVWGLWRWREGCSVVSTGALHLPGTLLVNKTSIKQTICQMNHWRRESDKNVGRPSVRHHYCALELQLYRVSTIRKYSQAMHDETVVVFFFYMEHFKSCIMFQVGVPGLDTITLSLWQRIIIVFW